MDAQELCLKIEQATKSLIPLSVTPVKVEGRIATVRIVAEAFSGMAIPIRIKAVYTCLDAFDMSLARTTDLAFELLSPAEDNKWNQSSDDKDHQTSGNSGIAAQDVTP